MDLAEFEKAIQSPIPVLVDYYADWCGPCKMLTPLLSSISQELDGKLKIVKIDVDQSFDLVARQGIRSVPTLSIYKDGKYQSQKIGALSRTQLLEFLAPYLS
jgi:thioredoxin 1